MQIKINGEIQTLQDGLTVEQLLQKLGYAQQFLAIAINRQSVPRSCYGVTAVYEHDEIEILAPMSGG